MSGLPVRLERVRSTIGKGIPEFMSDVPREAVVDGRWLLRIRFSAIILRSWEVIPRDSEYSGDFKTVYPMACIGGGLDRKGIETERNHERDFLGELG